jgi:hypothetical protein
MGKLRHREMSGKAAVARANPRQHGLKACTLFPDSHLTGFEVKKILISAFG